MVIGEVTFRTGEQMLVDWQGQPKLVEREEAQSEVSSEVKPSEMRQEQQCT